MKLLEEYLEKVEMHFREKASKLEQDYKDPSISKIKDKRNS